MYPLNPNDQEDKAKAATQQGALGVAEAQAQDATVAGIPAGASQYSYNPTEAPAQPVEQQGPPSPDMDLKPDRGNIATMVRSNFQKDAPTYDELVRQSATAIGSFAGKMDKAGWHEMMALNEKTVGDGVAAKEEVWKQVETGYQRWAQDNNIPPSEEKKKRFALKNVFNTIRPEEMSLFLIDFGMRAMIAGESMGNLGALGAAGSGAMGALQGRREKAKQDEIAASERALSNYQTVHGIAKDRYTMQQKDRELAQEERKLQRGEFKVIETPDGYFRLNLETGDTEAVVDSEGAALKPSSKGKEFEKQWAIQALVATDEYDEKQATLIIVGKAKTREEATALAEEVWLANLEKGVPPGITAADLRQKKKEYTDTLGKEAGMAAYEEWLLDYESVWKGRFIKAVAVPDAEKPPLSSNMTTEEEEAAAATRALAQSRS